MTKVIEEEVKEYQTNLAIRSINQQLKPSGLTLADLNERNLQQRLVSKLIRNQRGPEKHLYGSDNRFLGKIDVIEVLNKKKGIKALIEYQDRVRAAMKPEFSKKSDLSTEPDYVVKFNSNDEAVQYFDQKLNRMNRIASDDADLELA